MLAIAPKITMNWDRMPIIPDGASDNIEEKIKQLLVFMRRGRRGSFTRFEDTRL
jgi:hypothetical protein